VVSLYARLLGASWAQVADPIRLAHAAGPGVHGHGRMRIRHGRNAAARLLARLLRMPAPNDAAETRLVVNADADGELWVRSFGRDRMVTRQFPSADGELAERIGPLEFTFHIEASHGGICYRQIAAALRFGSLRLPLPAICAPHVSAREDPAGAHRVRVQVAVAHPFVGPVITYDGTIEIEEARA
jgi:hypothetical protein